MPFLLRLKNQTKFLRKTFFNNTSSFYISIVKKPPITDLKKMKENLKISSSNPNISLANTSKADTKNLKQEPKTQNKIEKKEKNKMLDYFILKEKELSSKILKCSSEKEITKIFKKELHKKY